MVEKREGMSLRETADTKYRDNEKLSVLEFFLLSMNRDLWDAENFRDLRILWKMYEENYARTVSKSQV